MSQAWGVVLAAGSGRRLASVTGGVPKQFWRPPGGLSLLEQTLTRLQPLTSPDRTVIVIDDTHGAHLAGDSTVVSPARVLRQPMDRGTAAGVLFALAPVLRSAPDDIVVITPSDHGVADRAGFATSLGAIVRHVRTSDDVVIVGVEPSGAQDDYGWITLGDETRPRTNVRRVSAFVEKPPKPVAQRLMASGAIWNTMVTVARASTLEWLYAEHLPALRDALAPLWQEREPDPRAVADAYAALPAHDFSRDLLTPAEHLHAYQWPASLGWSDLGTPDRLMRWLAGHQVHEGALAGSAA